MFIVKQLPVLPPEKCTEDLLDEIAPRVLELTYTAHDLAPFARDLGYDGPPFIWDDERRAQLRADLDGIYAHLYGLSRDDFAYILDQFPIVRQNDEKQFGEYRTKRLCLAAYDHFAPAALRDLDQQVKSIERALRGTISHALAGSAGALPPELRQKLEGQRAAHRRDTMGAPDGQISLGELLESAYLLDLQRIVLADAVWSAFAGRCGSRSRLRDAFTGLNDLRNALAHNRTMSEETRANGEAALGWFRKVLADE